MKNFFISLLILFSMACSAEEFVKIERLPTESEKNELAVMLKNVTDLSAEELQGINELSAIAIMHMQGVGKADFGYDEKSVSYLSSVIDKERPFPEKALNMFPKIWGAYLGNAIIKNYPGKWKKLGDGSYVVKLDSGLIMFPMRRAYKHMINGSEDSIMAMYASLKPSTPVVKNRP